MRCLSHASLSKCHGNNHKGLNDNNYWSHNNSVRYFTKTKLSSNEWCLINDSNYIPYFLFHWFSVSHRGYWQTEEARNPLLKSQPASLRPCVSLQAVRLKDPYPLREQAAEIPPAGLRAAAPGPVGSFPEFNRQHSRRGREAADDRAESESEPGKPVWQGPLSFRCFKLNISSLPQAWFFGGGALAPLQKKTFVLQVKRKHSTLS